MNFFIRIKSFVQLVRVSHIRGLTRDFGWRWVISSSWHEFFYKPISAEARMQRAQRFRQLVREALDNPAEPVYGGGAIVPPEYQDEIKEWLKDKQTQVVVYGGLYIGGLNSSDQPYSDLEQLRDLGRHSAK